VPLGRCAPLGPPPLGGLAPPPLRGGGKDTLTLGRGGDSRCARGPPLTPRTPRRWRNAVPDNRHAADANRVAHRRRRPRGNRRPPRRSDASIWPRNRRCKDRSVPGGGTALPVHHHGVSTTADPPPESDHAASPAQNATDAGSGTAPGCRTSPREQEQPPSPPRNSTRDQRSEFRYQIVSLPRSGGDAPAREPRGPAASAASGGERLPARNEMARPQQTQPAAGSE